MAREYKKQAKVNAVNYIIEKYGFEAKVKSVWVQRLGEFDPFPNNAVFVTMKWADDEFVVRIAGDEETSEGFDNYQQEEILAGGYVEPDVAVNYINQGIAEIDVEKVKEQTGINQFLFVDYDSKEHYEAILQSEERRIWNPKRNLPYINEYLTVEFDETTYVNCEKKVVDNILFVTESRSETVKVEKLPGFTGGFHKKNARLVFDVYSLETESDIVHVFVPIEALSNPGRKKPEFWIKVEGEEKYEGGNLTDDEKYVGTTIYKRDYEGTVEFSAIVWED